MIIFWESKRCEEELEVAVDPILFAFLDKKRVTMASCSIRKRALVASDDKRDKKDEHSRER